MGTWPIGVTQGGQWKRGIKPESLLGCRQLSFLGQKLEEDNQHGQCDKIPVEGHVPEEVGEIVYGAAQSLSKRIV